MELIVEYREIFFPIIRSKANIYTREINGQTLTNLIFAETSYQIRCFFVLSHSKNSYTIDESHGIKSNFNLLQPCVVTILDP